MIYFYGINCARDVQKGRFYVVWFLSHILQIIEYYGCSKCHQNCPDILKTCRKFVFVAKKAILKMDNFKTKYVAQQNIADAKTGYTTLQ